MVKEVVIREIAARKAMLGRNLRETILITGIMLLRREKREKSHFKNGFFDKNLMY